MSAAEIKPKILIVEPHTAGRDALNRLNFLHPEMAGLYAVEENYENAPNFDAVIGFEQAGVPIFCDVVIRAPYRIGTLVDCLRTLIQRIAEARSNSEKVQIGPYILDAGRNNLEKVGAPPIRLTEKEKEILLILRRENSAPLHREVLLSRIWAYAEGVQTHTLETHIYRLRQKIEEDPARPKILLTAEEGYFLAEPNE